MTFFQPQNPGIGGLDELTNAEELFLTRLAGLSYSEGNVLTIVSGQPVWAVSSGVGGSGNIDGGDANDVYLPSMTINGGSA